LVAIHSLSEDLEQPSNHVTGEGHFDDGNKPSGTATPVATETAGKVVKKRKLGSKKAKTTKQRLAIADGMVD
jgi:chromatin-remodeling ATPase INO80